MGRWEDQPLVNMGEPELYGRSQGTQVIVHSLHIFQGALTSIIRSLAAQEQIVKQGSPCSPLPALPGLLGCDPPDRQAICWVM